MPEILTDSEAKRRADFADCPILESYLATMLEDMQFSENDEACSEGREAADTGTIYTLPDAEYETCKAACVKFYTENKADIDEADELIPGEPGLQYTQARYMDAGRVGSTFYLLRVGHGIAFTDDGDAPCLERLNEATRAMRSEANFFGGGFYIS